MVLHYWSFLSSYETSLEDLEILLWVEAIVKD